MKSTKVFRSEQELNLNGNTESNEIITNAFSLTPNKTRLYDELWKKAALPTEEPSFIQRCQILCYGTRLRTNVFKNLPAEMRVWPGWKQVSRNLKGHLPEFHGMLEYVVRSIFKGFCSSKGSIMFEWFINQCASKMKVTISLVAAIKRRSNVSTEKRALQAILNSSFTRDQLKTILKDNKDLLNEFQEESIVERTDQRGTAQKERPVSSTLRSATVVTENGERRTDSIRKSCESDDEIIDVMSTDESESEEEEDDAVCVCNGQKGEDDLAPDLFVRSQFEESTPRQPKSGANGNKDRRNAEVLVHTLDYIRPETNNEMDSERRSYGCDMIDGGTTIDVRTFIWRTRQTEW